MFQMLLSRVFSKSAPKPRRRRKGGWSGGELLEDRKVYAADFSTAQWSNWVTSSETEVLRGDFNGDGRDDVMKFDVRENGDQGTNGLWVGLSNGGGYDTSWWADWVTNRHTKFLAGDFNGDGRDDVMKFDVRSNGDQGTNGLWVGLSNGGGFNTSKWADWVTSSETEFLVGDFNGDGRDDVMKFDVRANGDQGTNGVWVGLSNGGGFDTSKWADWVTNRHTKFLAGDFNGDGRDDVMKFDVRANGDQGTNGVWVGLSNGGGYDTSWWADWVTSRHTKVLAGDFNGDRVDDVMKFDVRSNGDQGTNGLWVGLSNQGTFHTTRWASWVTSSQTKVLAGDFNGDGRDDVMKFDVRSNGDQGWNGLWVGVAKNTPLGLSGLSHGAAEAGQPFRATITVDGGSFLYRDLRASSLPTGLSARLENDTIVISGTPTQALPTAFAARISLRDSTGAAIERVYSIQVRLGLSAGISSATAGADYVQRVTVAGGSGSYTFSLESGALPAGVTLSRSGELRGVTTRAGSYQFTIRATDNARTTLTSTRVYTLVVNPAAASAVRLDVSSTTTQTGGRVTATLTVVDRFGNRAAHNGTVWLNSGNTAVFGNLAISVANGQGTGTLIASRSGTATLSAAVNGIVSNAATITVNPTLWTYTYRLDATFSNGGTLFKDVTFTLASDQAANHQAGLESDAWRIELSRFYRDPWVSVTPRRLNRAAAN